MHVRACALLSPLFMPALFGPKVDNRKISHLYIFSAFVGAEFTCSLILFSLGSFGSSVISLVVALLAFWTHLDPRRPFLIANFIAQFLSAFIIGCASPSDNFVGDIETDLSRAMNIMFVVVGCLFGFISCPYIPKFFINSEEISEKETFDAKNKHAQDSLSVQATTRRVNNAVEGLNN